MKTIGLIGGMSWESSLEYYRIINESVKDSFGGLHSAQSLMYSVDFAEVEELQREERWDNLTEFMIKAALNLEKGGADFLVICTNTMHLMAEDIEKNIRIPLLHIADATAGAVKQRGLSRVGLLGTNFTMEKDFYRERLARPHAIEVLTPPKTRRDAIHRIIYDELCRGVISKTSREIYCEVITELAERGAEGVILGCTEIGLLIGEKDVDLPLFDTTRIHAEAAVSFALENGSKPSFKGEKVQV